jgi:hypothetical protein
VIRAGGSVGAAELGELTTEGATCPEVDREERHDHRRDDREAHVGRHEEGEPQGHDDASCASHTRRAHRRDAAAACERVSG